MKEFKLNTRSFLLLMCLVIFSSLDAVAQQDPQYTQYMYNTMSINPAYAGQREVLSITGLYRTQWVGIDGAPKTQTLGIHAPLRNERIGLGLSVVNDALGPAEETYIDANLSYSIPLDYDYTTLSFGVKAGLHQLSTDWSKGKYQTTDPLFNEPISRLSPTVGVGVYVSNREWYLGVSAPNLLTTDHYDDFIESIATERINFYAIAGYVFDINNDLKLKPSAFIKAVSGAPVIGDISLNGLYREKLTLGLAWRWDDSVSLLTGFQISDGLYVGYAYDLTTTGLNNYNSGSHEIMLRFELRKAGRLLSPRFF
ncbi:type IX secretion system membrane protein, PorP/SprF family [Algibacter lectus]|uniref:PorP/SprF family type IX secretion system membrane protein n=1 Tax=Algibacter lectus TaxID=221126 RepID=UPI0008E7554E|nr:type IX secretion system membrane protein PorP/SprF [Algibacter lectus]SFD28944.1 type IX secretion system membrane protein, PorP/SprF family [Algibacter lectus]